MTKTMIMKILLVLSLFLFGLYFYTATSKEIPSLTIEIFSDSEIIKMLQLYPEDIERAGIHHTAEEPIIEITIISKYHKVLEEMTTRNIGKQMILKSNAETLFLGKIMTPIKEGKMVLEGFSDDDVNIFFQKLGREPDYYDSTTHEELEASKDYLEPTQNPWYQKAVYADLEHDYVRAEKYIKKAIESAPQDYFYYLFLGEIYYKQDKKQLALKEYLKSEEFLKKIEIKKRPPVPVLFIRLGDLYAELNEYEKAIEYYNKLFDVYGYEPSTQMKIAGVYEKMGEYDLALKEYRSLSKSNDEEICEKAKEGIKRIKERIKGSGK
jgi:tetratricopeptide (TPR) repeat protein